MAGPGLPSARPGLGTTVPSGDAVGRAAGRARSQPQGPNNPRQMPDSSPGVTAPNPTPGAAPNGHSLPAPGITTGGHAPNNPKGMVLGNPIATRVGR
jgi:hypothetical protein